MDKKTYTNLLLVKGNRGEKVAALKTALTKRVPQTTTPLSAENNLFDRETESVLRQFQSQAGLIADGIAGPRTQAALKLTPSPPHEASLTIDQVATLFPHTPKTNIGCNLPYIFAALSAFGLNSSEMVSLALAALRVDSEGFTPIYESPSHANTLPGHSSFSRYENRRLFGNTRVGDGYMFRGRGYAQLKGRRNYQKYSEIFDIPLEDNPDYACAPEVASCLFVDILWSKRDEIQKALLAQDFLNLRKLIYGSSHDIDTFRRTFDLATEIQRKRENQDQATIAASSATDDSFLPTLNVQHDPADLRDRTYTPPPVSLPAIFPDDLIVKQFIGTYSKAGLILDQGREGACTGFGLACVINFLRWRTNNMPEQLESVSPRMLYHFAQRYDEYEGENYEGSSCRGALKGWFHNGVCLDNAWPYRSGDNISHPLPGWDREAIEHTLGVYYRINKKSITDLQAAIHEVGAIFVSSYTHQGWRTVNNTASAPTSHRGLPVISFDGTVSRRGGHAFALVGYNRQGFVIQNSWGKRWGAAGFAVITYRDWLLHCMDAWVAAMGVPGVLSGRLASPNATGTPLSRSQGSDLWWDEATAYQHSILLGNNGKVERFNQIDGINNTLHHQGCIQPDSWMRNNGQQKKRLVLYAHGGLNSEESGIQRAQAMGRYFLANGCYPLFLVWKTGVLESIGDILTDKFTQEDEGRARGFVDWLSNKVSDPVIEKTIGRPFAKPIWSEMKENASLATEDGRGGKMLLTALSSLANTWGDDFELHLIGHSAGSIILGHLLSAMKGTDLLAQVASLHLYAPACTVKFANQYFAPHKSVMKKLYMDILSDEREQDDHVAKIYRKSLLYFVSNALEADSRTPLLGMHNVYNPDFTGWDGSSLTAEGLRNWQDAVRMYRIDKRLTVHYKQTAISRLADENGQDAKTIQAAHGSFDNDIDVVSKTIQRITGSHQLTLAVDDLAGF